MGFNCHFLPKMSQKSVPKHFHHGVCNFHLLFVANTAVYLFWDTFVSLTMECLQLIDHPIYKLHCFLIYN